MISEESPPAVTTPLKTLSENRGSVVISRGDGVIGWVLSKSDMGRIMVRKGPTYVEDELTEGERAVKYRSQ